MHPQFTIAIAEERAARLRREAERSRLSATCRRTKPPKDRRTPLRAGPYGRMIRRFIQPRFAG